METEELNKIIAAVRDSKEKSNIEYKNPIFIGVLALVCFLSQSAYESVISSIDEQEKSINQLRSEFIGLKHIRMDVGDIKKDIDDMRNDMDKFMQTPHFDKEDFEQNIEPIQARIDRQEDSLLRRSEWMTEANRNMQDLHHRIDSIERRENKK